MPAHLHAAPQCTGRAGQPCGATTCRHTACLNGGRFLSCEKTSDGMFFCFHAEYYLGPDVLSDAQAAVIQKQLGFGRAAPGGAIPLIAAAPDPIGDLIRQFAARSGHGVFPWIPRERLAQDLLMRLRNPAGVKQGQTWMCGPAAFMYSFLNDHPLEYARFVTQMYETGSAPLNGLHIRASTTFRNARMAPGTTPADWVALGSLRDSSNWIFGYQYNSYIEHLRGGTLAGDVVTWFKNTGYHDVQDWTEGHGRAMNARLANQFFNQGYKVCLMVDADVLGDTKDAASVSILANHFVVLTSPIEIGDDGVTFSVFTWGSGSWRIPSPEPGKPRKMPLATFLSKYYGFIAAKP